MKTLRYVLFPTLLLFISLSCSTGTNPLYILKTSVSPGEGGSVSPAQGEYDSGTDVEIMASPNEHWVFQNWQGDQGGTGNPATVKMDADKEITAVFVKREYPLTIVTDGEGTVGEVVVQAKSTDYPHGTMVELTANAAEGWFFVEWQGDLSGSENPETITVSDATSIIAVFERQNYGLDIKTEGSGSVTEEVVHSKSTDYPFESEVKLTAVGDNGWGFRAWKGDINTTQNPITVEVMEDMEITAVFNECVTDNCLDMYYSQTSYLTTKPYLHNNFTDFYTGWHMPLEAVVLDYDQDGFMDLVHTNSDYDASFAGQEVRNTVQFFKGDSEGNLSIDHTLSGKFDGLVHGRKGIVGDFTNNGYPDIVFAGHGVDQPPFPGEYPIILLNQEGEGFTEIRLTELVSFWHSIASGDVNNDGNLDIVLVDPFLHHGGGVILLNDGSGNFTVQEQLIPMDKAGVTSELFDINKDGYLDLFVPGADTESSHSSLIYGNGQDFLGSYVSLPSVTGYGIAVDIDFYDINEDGNYEIIVNRTSDGTLENVPDTYVGWYIQVLELTGGEYTDATDKFLTDYTHESEDWIQWLHISDRNNDGIIRLYSNELNYNVPRHEWELRNGKFVKVN